MSDDYDLGTYARSAVTAASDAARAWFDRGLVWCYAFNHEEAIACFKRALDRRPRLRAGPLGHRLCDRPQLQQAMGRFRCRRQAPLARRVPVREVAAAAASAGNATPAEQALIAALARRYPPTR